MATRNKKNIAYTIVRPHQLPVVHKLMYQSFHKDEPMTNFLGLCKGSFSIPDSDEMVEDLVLNHNLSIMATDMDTNTPLAVVLNGVMGENEALVPRSEVIDSCLDPGFVPIACILHEVQLMSGGIFTKYKADRLFDVKMIATAPEARGHGLATDLVQRSVQLAACLGFRGCKTEATGTYSRKAFQKCGFDLVADVKYAQFKIGEKKVFAGIQGHEGEEEEDEEVSLESPSKRIRLSSAEDEAGPCDSQDGVSQLSKPMVLEENGESISSAAVCAGPPSPGSETSSSEAMMDIDAECTSSEARLLTCAPTEATGPASTSTDASRLLDHDGQAGSEKGTGSEVNGCDSNSGVTTSAPKPGDEGGLPNVNMEEEEKVAFSGAEPSSSEGAGVILQPVAPEGLQEVGTPDCSSSNQATIADRDSVSPTNSEAEPAGEVVEEAEEGVARENGVGGEVQEEGVETNQQDVSPPASVQSSEEATRVEVKQGGRGANESGAADSSDQAQTVATMEGAAGEKKEDTSPDQSGTS